MSVQAAYPFKRIDPDALSAAVHHDLEDKNNVLLNVGKAYQYSCEIAPPHGGWSYLWNKVGVVGGTLLVYWASGGAGSTELLLRRIREHSLPRVGGESFCFSFAVLGYQHTHPAAVILRIISDDKEVRDNLGAEQGEILWEENFPIEVRGSGEFLKVEYAAAPADKKLAAGPGDWHYSPDRGYELVVYTDHLPKELHTCGAVIHGAIAILLERALRHAYLQYRELTETRPPSSESTGDGDETRMLKNILELSEAGRKSPRSLLEQEAKNESRDNEYALSNWCWEAAGSIAVRQTEAWLESTGLPVRAGEDK